MYEVQMKYMDTNSGDESIIFKCENFKVHSDGYSFGKVLMDNFIINDFEINHRDIALIKIK